MCIRTLKFRNSNLISGSPDFRLRINPIASKSMFSFINLFYLIILAIAVFIGMNQNLKSKLIVNSSKLD